MSYQAVWIDRRTSAFCVGVRPAVAQRCPTHFDTDQKHNAPDCLSGRAESIYIATSDTTKQFCVCRVWRGGVNWTIAINVFRLKKITVGDSLELPRIQFTPPKRMQHIQDIFVMSGVAV